MHKSASKSQKCTRRWCQVVPMWKSSEGTRGRWSPAAAVECVCGFNLCRYSRNTSASTYRRCQSRRSRSRDTSPSVIRCAPRPCAPLDGRSASSSSSGRSASPTAHLGSAWPPSGSSDMRYQRITCIIIIIIIIIGFFLFFALGSKNYYYYYYYYYYMPSPLHVV